MLESALLSITIFFRVVVTYFWPLFYKTYFLLNFEVTILIRLLNNKGMSEELYLL